MRNYKEFIGTFQFNYTCPADNENSKAVSQTINITYPYNMADANPNFYLPNVTDPKNEADCALKSKIKMSGDVRYT